MEKKTLTYGTILLAWFLETQMFSEPTVSVLRMQVCTKPLGLRSAEGVLSLNRSGSKASRVCLPGEAVLFLQRAQ